MNLKTFSLALRVDQKILKEQRLKILHSVFIISLPKTEFQIIYLCSLSFFLVHLEDMGKGFWIPSNMPLRRTKKHSRNEDRKCGTQSLYFLLAKPSVTFSILVPCDWSVLNILFSGTPAAIGIIFI